MNLRLTLVALCLFLGLGWYLLPQQVPAPERKTLEQEDFENLTVVRDNSFQLIKTDNDWRLAELPEAELEPDAVKAFVEVLGGLSGSNLGLASEFSEEQLSSFGLSSPSLSIYSKSGSSFDFGELNNLTGRRYLKLKKTTGDEASILMVGEDSFKVLSQGRDSLRVVKPFSFPIREVSSLIVRDSRFKVSVITKNEREQFFLKRGTQLTPIDEEFVAILLGSLSNLEVKKYIDNRDDFENFGLKPTKLTLAVNFGDEKFENVFSYDPLAGYVPGESQKKIHFGEKLTSIGSSPSKARASLNVSKEAKLHKQYFFFVEGQKAVYQYEHPPYLGLLGAVEQMRDRTPFNAWKPGEIEVLKVLRKGEAVILDKQLMTSLAEAISSFQVVSFLEGASTRKSSSTEEKKSPIGEERFSVEFKLVGHNEVFKIRVGEKLEGLNSDPQPSGGNALSDAPYFTSFQSPTSPETLAVLSSQARKNLESLK